MRLRLTLPFALFATASACGSVPDDPGARLFAAQGVIRGSVLYSGPRPCSSNGHIVGAAILFVFDRHNPPPPNGLATTPVNFGVVTGDALFPNEPRYTGPDIYCPLQAGFTDTITVTAPFAIAPMAGGSYMIQSFYDYTGDFLPTFKFRQLPERGDIGGGDIDTADALKAINAGNPNYSPRFLEVNVGIPEPLQNGQTIPTYDIPSTGYVADNVAVTLGESLPFTRPYLWAQGIKATYAPGASPNTSTITEDVGQDSACPHGQASPPNCGTNCPTSCPTGDDAIPNTAETDDNYKPILTIPQDLKVFSPPSAQDPDGANVFDAGFPHIKLVFGVPDSEKPCATNGSCTQSIAPGNANPFHFQLDNTGFNVWQNAFFNSDTQKWTPLQIPEGGGLPMLWPLVILSKLVDNQPDPSTGVVDPRHGNDPASLTAQGDAKHPVIIMQGITLLNEQTNNNPLTGAPAQADSILNTVLAGGPSLAPGLPPVVPNTLFNYSSGQPCAKWDTAKGVCVQDGTKQQDHLMVALRPSVICFNHLFDNPPPPDTRGVLVSPYSSNNVATAPGGQSQPGPIVPVDLLNIDPKTNVSGDDKVPVGRFQVTNLVNSVKYGCLPKGRYAINVVYPDGQAWTVPNEAGACTGGTEGTTDFGSLTCQLKPRPVLYSQGNRAIVEVVGPTDPASCQDPGPQQDGQPHGPPGDPAPATGHAFAVPAECQ